MMKSRKAVKARERIFGAQLLCCNSPKTQEWCTLLQYWRDAA